MADTSVTDDVSSAKDMKIATYLQESAQMADPSLPKGSGNNSAANVDPIIRCLALVRNQGWRMGHMVKLNRCAP